jgi:hypothetical protein
MQYTEEDRVCPMTPEEAMFKYRGLCKVDDFPRAPSKKIRTGIIDILEATRFAFVYSRKVKQYFIFIDAYSNEFHIARPYSVMKIYLIAGSEIIFCGKRNIILSAPVYSDPHSEWHEFIGTLTYFTSRSNGNDALEYTWEIFADHHGVETSD